MRVAGLERRRRSEVVGTAWAIELGASALSDAVSGSHSLLATSYKELKKKKKGEVATNSNGKQQKCVLPCFVVREMKHWWEW